MSYEITSNNFEQYLQKIKDSSSTSNAIYYVISAQLNVINALNFPTLNLSVADLLIEDLDKALSLADNAEAKKDLQLKSCIMINSLVFFAEAKLIYEKDKNSQKAKEALMQGCELVAQSSNAIIGAIPGVSVLVDASNIFEKITTRGGPWEAFIDWWQSETKIKKHEAELKSFLISLIDKLGRHQALFGRSIVVSEMIHKYKDIIIDAKLPSEPCPPRKPSVHDFIPYIKLHSLKAMKLLQNTTFLISFPILVIFSILYLLLKCIDLLPFVNFNTITQWTWKIMLLALLLIPVTAICLLIMKLIGELQYKIAFYKAGKTLQKKLIEYEEKNKEYQEELRSYKRLQADISQKYDALAKSFLSEQNEDLKKKSIP